VIGRTSSQYVESLQPLAPLGLRKIAGVGAHQVVPSE
jgi:hypothetical protein